jgi:hypothetical protein
MSHSVQVRMAPCLRMLGLLGKAGLATSWQETNELSDFPNIGIFIASLLLRFGVVRLLKDSRDAYELSVL